MDTFNRETAHRALGKYYMIITGDAPQPSGEIKKMVNNIGKADMILIYYIERRRVARRTLSRVYNFIINLITLNNIKYYNGTNIHLLENVKLYSGKGSGFGYSAELITAQIREKKTYVEVETSYIPHPHLSQLPAPRVMPSVIGSIISIFFNQIIHVVKKILKIK